MKTSAFTWLGLAIVAAGWGLLIADLVISDVLLHAGALVAIVTLRADVLTVAQTAILSGFGLALIGVLRSGFGAFNRFFDAVLHRASAPRMPVPDVAKADPLVQPPPPSAAEPLADVTLVARATPPRATPQPVQPAKPHNYVILPDGSVEVETMFGTRIFATIDEAKDFIR